MVAEFESDLIRIKCAELDTRSNEVFRMRTREGMKIAKAKARLHGKKPKLSASQEQHLVKLYQAGEHTSSQLAELFNVARSTVYRAIHRSETADALALEPLRFQR